MNYKVSIYNYLEIEMPIDGRMDAEIGSRIQKTNKVYYVLNKPIVENKEIDKKC